MSENLITQLDICTPIVLDWLNGNLGLLYYSHIPAIIISLLFGVFVLLNAKERLLAKVFFFLSLMFALWSVLDLYTWLGLNTSVIMFTWALIGLVEVMFFVLGLYFMYVFAKKKDAPFVYKVAIAILLLPLIVMIPMKLNLSGFSLDECYSLESNVSLYYKYFIQLLSAGVLTVFSLVQIKKAKKGERTQLTLLLIGMLLFLLSFFSAVFVSGYLADTGLVSGYGFEIYGLFGTIVFMGFLAYIIVTFEAFSLKLIGAQVLIVSLGLLIGSQFFFVTNNTNRVLTAISLLITLVIGVNLIKSVKKEIEARELIEKKEKELEIANEGQSNLLHFITHQVKGYFTKSRAIFQGMVDGDFGEFPEQSKEIVQEGFKSATEGVDLVQNVLNASNLEKGTVQYTEDGLDINEIVQDVISHKQEQVDAKGLNLKINIEKGDYKTKGDPLQLKEVFKNLIDNAIRYTPKGDVNVNLSLNDGMILFYVKDSGVGITDSDMTKLFKKGSHGENSRDVNPESTGYGLYIVKEIVEAHGGRVWVESEGANKGSTFFVQLPIKN